MRVLQNQIFGRGDARLLNYVPEPIALSVGQLPEQLPQEIDLIAKIHEENALIINALKKQQQEIQETKQLAQEAINRTEYITKGEFWDLHRRIKKLKDMGDKYIWRDVERMFRISNLGQLPASEYQTCIEFLKDREEALFKNQPKINKW